MVIIGIVIVWKVPSVWGWLGAVAGVVYWLLRYSAWNVNIWVVTVAWLAPSSTDSWPLVEVKVLVVPAGTVAENSGVKLAGLVTLIQHGAPVVTTTS